MMSAFSRSSCALQLEVLHLVSSGLETQAIKQSWFGQEFRVGSGQRMVNAPHVSFESWFFDLS
jgi:hypothetical protein